MTNFGFVEVMKYEPALGQYGDAWILFSVLLGDAELRLISKRSSYTFHLQLTYIIIVTYFCMRVKESNEPTAKTV